MPMIKLPDMAFFVLNIWDVYEDEKQRIKIIAVTSERTENTDLY